MAQITLKPIPRLPDVEVLPIEQPSLKIGVRPLLLFGLLLGLIVMFLLVLSLGSVDIPMKDIITVLTGGEATKHSWTQIILKFRLPKATTAMLAGAALAVSGLQMQTFFRNPLADPFVLGINSGASLGVALVVLSAGTIAGTMLAGVSLIGDFALASAASIGAGIVMMGVLIVARRVQSSASLLIVGLMFGYLTGAVVSLLIYFSLSERVQAYINWTFGSFGGVTWSQMKIFAPVIIVGLLIALSLSKSLNALLLGEQYALTMGLNLTRTRIAIIMSTALLAGAVTAFCGPIAFIGIAVPHLCRGMLGTSDHRFLVPATILMGGIVALAAALIAEMPGTRIVLPVNAVTSLIGAPVVLWVILRRGGFGKEFGA